MAAAEALARTYYDTVDAGDPAATAALFAPDGTYDRPGYDTLTGAQISDFYHDARVIESGAHTLDEIIADGNRAAVRGRFDGVLKSGAEAHEGFADFFVFDDAGLIAKRTSYFFRAAV